MNEITWRVSCLLLSFHFCLHKFSNLFFFLFYFKRISQSNILQTTATMNQLQNACCMPSHFFIFDMISFCSSESPTFLPHPTYIHTHSSQLSKAPLKPSLSPNTTTWKTLIIMTPQSPFLVSSLTSVLPYYLCTFFKRFQIAYSVLNTCQLLNKCLESFHPSAVSLII